MPVPVELLGLFDMPLLEELGVELLLFPLVDEPELLAPVLLGVLECEELLPPAALLPFCPALYSSRLSLPSWFVSSWSNDLLALDDDEPPEAALFCDDEPELLLCDMDGDLELVLLDCFDVSLA